MSTQPTTTYTSGDPWNGEIDELLADLESLGAEATTAEQFYPRFLQAITAAANSDTAAYWRRVGDGLHCVAKLPSNASHDGLGPRRLIAVLQSGVAQILSADGEAATNRWLACPVKAADAPVGVVVCSLPAAAGSRVAALLDVVAAFGEVADEFELRQQIARLQVGAEQAARAQTFLLDVHRASGLCAVARTVAEEGRRLVDCDRLTVLLPRGGGWRVAAVSGVEKPSPRSDAVRGVEQLVREATRTGEPVTLRDGDAEEHPPALAEALDRHIDGGFARELMVVPCRLPATSDTESERGRATAALLVEQFEGTLPGALEPIVGLVADHTAVAVDHAQYAGPLGGVRRRMASVGFSAGVRRAMLATTVALVFAAAVAALCFVPAELKVAAEGRLAPTERSRVFAPLDAAVARVLVGHADTVAKGDALVELRSETLELELEQALEALATTQQEIASLETAKLRAGLPGVATETDVSAVTSRIESLREQTGFQQRRIELLREQQAKLIVVSPLDGKVVSWRPRDYLADRPVRRGQRLMEVAAVASGDDAKRWTIEIDVPDRRAGHLLTAAAAAEATGEPLLVDFVMKSAPAIKRQGRVTGVASITQANADGQPMVRVEVEPIDDGPITRDTGAEARSGSTVLAKIHCGEHSLGYVWFHEAWEAIQRVWF